MRQLLLPLLFIPTLIGSLIGRGQPLTFKPLLSEEQRHQVGSDLLAATQDEHGLLWLSTQTRCWRFDGQQLHSLNDLSQTADLRGSAHLALADSSLWLEQAGEVCQFDLRTYRFRRWPQRVQNSLNQPLTHLTDLSVDPLGRLWASYWNGLALRRSDGGWMGGHAYLAEPGTYVAAVTFGPDSSLCVVSENYLSRVVFRSLAGLQVSSVQHIALPEELAHGRADLTDLVMISNPDPVVYLGSSLGLYAFSFNPGQGTPSVQRLPWPKEGRSLMDRFCHDLMLDPEGRTLWVSTDQGAWGWDSEALTWTGRRSEHGTHGVVSLRWNDQQTLMVLQGASLWYMDSGALAAPQAVGGGQGTFLPDQIWRQAEAGGEVWPIHQATPFLLPHRAENRLAWQACQVMQQGQPLPVTYLHALPGANAQHIYCSDQGLLWLTRAQGTDRPTWQVSRQLDGSVLPSRFPNLATPSPRDEQHLWVGFWRTGREVLIRLNRTTGAYTPFMSFENATWSLSSDIIGLRAKATHEGEELWISTRHRGVLRTLYRPGAQQLYLLEQFDSLEVAGHTWPLQLLGEPEPLDDVHWLLPDAQGWFIWSSASGQAQLLHDQLRGEPLRGQQAYRDQRGQVWLSAYGRWYALTGSNGRYQAHAPALGVAGTEAPTGFWDRPTGVGLLSAHSSWDLPAHWPPATRAPAPRPILTHGRWTSLSEGGTPTRHQQGLTYEALWKLPAHCRSLEVAVSLPGEDNPWYWYQLEGIDPEPVRSKLGVIRYTNLPPGQYRLQVRPDQPSGQPQDAVRTLVIEVLPPAANPWWWLGLGGLVLFLLGAMLGGVRFFRRSSGVRVGLPPLAQRPAASWNEGFLAELRSHIEAKLDDPQLSVQGLAQEMSLSHSQFTRKVKALTQRTPVELIKEIRLQHAAHLLRLGRYQICEVAYLSGFSDPDYFRRCFKQVYGVSPRVYQSQGQEKRVRA